MAEQSKIAWTDDTWNPWRGCAKVSPGCVNCYAEELVTRFKYGSWGKGRPRVRAAAATLKAPFKWNKKPWVCEDCGHAFSGVDCHASEDNEECCGPFHRRRVFSLSLGDWLDPEVPIEWLADMLDTIRQCPDLDFLLLTKRIEFFRERMCEAVASAHATGRSQLQQWLNGWLDGSPPPNVWLGASVEDQPRADERIPLLLQTPAKVRFLSVEPLLSPITFRPRVELNDLVQHTSLGKLENLTQPSMLGGISWVIVGGESGKHRRDCGAQAIAAVAEQCRSAGVPCFVKQDCALRPGQQGRIQDEIWQTKKFPK